MVRKASAPVRRERPAETSWPRTPAPSPLSPVSCPFLAGREYPPEAGRRTSVRFRLPPVDLDCVRLSRPWHFHRSKVSESRDKEAESGWLHF